MRVDQIGHNRRDNRETRTNVCYGHGIYHVSGKYIVYGINKPDTSEFHYGTV